MKPSGIVTLTTDFGYSDPFVGQMKGALLSIYPQATIVDLTHDISSHDIEAGAFILSSSYRYFPSGTIHIAVVDPGVGSQRRGLVVYAGKHYFIGPDNGIFSGIMDHKAHRTIHITDGPYHKLKTGPTFHGRDVFAPVAAWLLKGTAITEFGPAVEDVVVIDMEKPEIHENSISGKVVYIDKFGNAITNIVNDVVNSGNATISVIHETKGAVSMAGTYAAAKGRELHALFNSSGYLELFVNQNNAASLYGIRKGDKVSMSLSPFQDDP